ncbi:MAG TPA: hypothetical protein VM100_01985 [Longimicrobiales bacterium]|nr:hypothetical protein [Longimicrobiales bacterium]
MKYKTFLFVAFAAACSAKPDPTTSEQLPVNNGFIALTDLGNGTYKGYPGGLYPNGSNTVPAAHAQEGRRRLTAIQPLDASGNAAVNGRIVFLSIGMSNGTQEFCTGSGYTNCVSWSFMGKATADATVNHTTLQMLNGARGGQVASSWTKPASAEYDRIRDQGLAPLNLNERQVQIVWTKIANSTPNKALPDANADAMVLSIQLDSIARALKTRYPNLQFVFFSSRIYAGFATTTLNPEPYAYETGFAHKWAIEKQINSRDYSGAWLAWGPYLWAGDQAHKRSDGLFYEAADFESDGTHPSTAGEGKVADQLLSFFKTSEFTQCWFLSGRRCN